MKVIHKHLLSYVDNADHGLSKVIPMALDAEVIKIDKQNGRIIIWEMHDTKWNEVMVNRCYIILGTGHEFEGTVNPLESIFDGHYVWHICEVLG